MINGATEASIISYLFGLVDQSGADLVANTYHRLVSQYASVAWTLAGIYLAFSFLKLQHGVYGANDFIFLSLRMIVILTLAMNYDYFCLFIYDIFTKAPLVICQSITIDHGTVGLQSIGQSLDTFIYAGMKEASKLFSMGSWTNWTYGVFGFIMLMMTSLSAGIAAGLIILAKCASTVLLALSPIFILFALFDATKGWFDSYLQQLLNYALLPIMTCTVLMILLSVTNTLTHGLSTIVKPSMIDIVPYCLMCLIEIYLLNEVRNKCATLVGGFSLPGIISSLNRTQSYLSSSAQPLKQSAITAGAIGAFTYKSGKTALSSLKSRLDRFR
jgi:type IV secretion system protein VirB6